MSGLTRKQLQEKVATAYQILGAIAFGYDEGKKPSEKDLTEALDFLSDDTRFSLPSWPVKEEEIKTVSYFGM